MAFTFSKSYICICLCHTTVFKFKQISRTVAIIYLLVKLLLLENKMLGTVNRCLHSCSIHMGKFLKCFLWF